MYSQLQHCVEVSGQHNDKGSRSLVLSMNLGGDKEENRNSPIGNRTPAVAYNRSCNEGGHCCNVLVSFRV